MISIVEATALTGFHLKKYFLHEPPQSELYVSLS